MRTVDADFVGWAKIERRDSSLKFKVKAPLELAMLSLWTMVSPSYHHRIDPLDAFRRGQSALSQHDRALAVYYLRQSLAAAYSHKEAYTPLAAAYREAGNVAEDAEKDQPTMIWCQFVTIRCKLVSLALSILPATDYTGR
jgi:hypothetical protein